MGRIPAGKRPRKRRRRGGGGAAAGARDCFTHLHDDVLRAIIQRLPIRSAASLAGASRHFRARVPALLDRVDSLTLYEPHFSEPLPDAGPLLLRRLVIAPHAAIPPISFRPILLTAAGHGLKELSICLTRRARLPKKVFSIRSLAVLTLDTCAMPRWSRIACPCLRTLKLHRVAIHQEIINQVLASASCLETLEMIYCGGFGTGTGGGCTVESSSVRNLVFRPPLKQAESTIRASGLRTVTLYTRAMATRLNLAPAPEIRKAYLHISKSLLQRPMDSFRIRLFLDVATKLNCLTLRGLAMKLLSSEYKDASNLEVMFQNMRTLSVSLNLSREREVVFLLKLLESCPNLQQLTLSDVNNDKDKAAKKIEDKAAGTDENMDFETDEEMASETDEDKAVPCFTDHKERLAKICCLTACLVEFKFLGFKPEGYAKSLVVFLLTQAKNLKKVGVQFPKNQDAIVKEILSVRNAPAQRMYNKYGGLYVELDYS